MLPRFSRLFLMRCSDCCCGMAVSTDSSHASQWGIRSTSKSSGSNGAPVTAPFEMRNQAEPSLPSATPPGRLRPRSAQACRRGPGAGSPARSWC